MRATLLIATILAVGMPNPAYFTNLKTGSMPCFQEINRVQYDERAEFQRLEVGDVICYRPSNEKLRILQIYSTSSPAARWFAGIFRGNNHMTCHRIINKGAGWVIAKGDSNRMWDPILIEKEDYRGKVIEPRCEQ